MARLGVRSGSVLFARWDGDPANKRFERTGANGREHRSHLHAEGRGSSPIIRAQNPPDTAGFVWPRVCPSCQTPAAREHALDARVHAVANRVLIARVTRDQRWG